MSGVLFPIAPNPEAALNAPLGRAGLESAARAAVAGAPLTFVRELAGPAFETREMAAAAYRGKLDEPGVTIAPADRYCELQPVMAQGGRLRTVWRLCVGYWKVLGERDLGAVPQARQARRSVDHAEVDKATLDAMAEQPLRPLQPQKALDMGLFEVRLPENPAVIIADE
jgi:hypothetical protein